MKITKRELKQIIKEALLEELGRKSSKRRVREASSRNKYLDDFDKYGYSEDWEAEILPELMKRHPNWEIGAEAGYGTDGSFAIITDDNIAYVPNTAKLYTKTIDELDDIFQAAINASINESYKRRRVRESKSSYKSKVCFVDISGSLANKSLLTPAERNKYHTIHPFKDYSEVVSYAKGNDDEDIVVYTNEDIEVGKDAEKLKSLSNVKIIRIDK